MACSKEDYFGSEPRSCEVSTSVFETRLAGAGNKGVSHFGQYVFASVCYLVEVPLGLQAD